MARSRVRIYMCLFQPNKTRQQDRTRIGPFSARFSRFLALGDRPGWQDAQDSGRPKTARCGFCGRSPGEVPSRITEACLALGHLPPAQLPVLFHAFQHGIDLHSGTAARVLGIAEADVDDEQRKLGKTLNFGIVYGQTAYGLADELGATTQRAEELLAAHATAYPGATAWTAAVHEQARNSGEVRTLYGRRRQLPNIYSASDALAAEARRQAVNTVVQGSAADLMKLALIRLNDVLPDGVRMLLPVHDSVLLEVPEALVEETQQIVVEAMENTPAGFTVPLKVEVKTGRTWAECKDTKQPYASE